MRRDVRSNRRYAGVAAIAGLAALAALLVTAAAPAAHYAGASAKAGHKCLVMTGSGDPAFVRNFNPYTATGLPSGGFVRGAFYEPLIISTVAGGGHTYPWLAKSWKWTNGNKTLNLTLQRGVKWSDGKPLTSADVVYSLTAGNQDKAMDMIGLTQPDTNVSSIKAAGPYNVVIKLRTVDSQFIPAVLNAQFVIPKHIWTGVSDPATFTNPNPVGSGPFASVGRFTTQDFVFNKNTKYWLKGSPKVPCLEYVQAASNDAALLQIQSGQVDWTHNFVPNVDQAYMSKDKAHYHAFYATTAYPISLVFDSTVYPYNLTAFRKALSFAINRSDVSKLGEYGYAPATDALGLNGIFPTWVTGAAKEAAQKAAAYNPTLAKKTLTDAGFTYKGSTLIDPKGNPVNLDIHVISGWSDWVASNQIITKNLQAIGINSKVALEPDWNSWYPNASATKFPSLLWQNASQGSPYGFFNSNMSQNRFTPSGQDATNTGNWAHYSNAKATTLLNQWKASLDVKKQKAIAAQLAQIFLADQPIVPLFVGPRWSTYSTKYFHCFASPKNFYGDPIFTTAPDNVLSFTRICPGGKAGA
ncbi:MAG: peptide/nickel transport system substrate-binding protein [Gaiellaceae bacterium]|jgi:peptide/nickel transport system substrate-binding protein|nr:peptide/nickel transport system substrate-binding protein [Gaiellaceae bacterium]